MITQSESHLNNPIMETLQHPISADQTNATSHVSLAACDDYCKLKQHSSETNLYYVIGALSILTVALAVMLGAVFSLYKKERNKRLAMWTVKTEDIQLEKIQWNPSEAAKTAEEKTKYRSPSSLEIVDEKSHLVSKKAKNYYTTTGYYQGRLVSVQKYKARRLSMDKKSLLADLDQICKINHEHICTFYGSNQGGGLVTVLTEYCTRGSLQDLLNDQAEWDDVFKNSLIFDIVKGMLYLHQTDIGSHGNLKPSNCLIDSRFMVKLTDFGIIGHRFKLKERSDKNSQVMMDSFKRKLWTAPELLRAVNPPPEGTKKGDVYSFAIIAQEIFYQKGVFYRTEDSLSAKEIIEQVIEPLEDKKEAFRPNLHDDDDIVIHEQWRKALKVCWTEDPKQRLDFQDIHQIAVGLQTENTLIDSLIHRLQKYSNRLEEKVEEKTEQYKAEKERSDSLLYQMLPQTVANRLKVNTDVMPESYSKVTVYFSDIVGFSAICHKSQPLEVVQMLNDLYTMFDQIIDEFDVYKVETIGDAYMVVSGLPIRNGNNHAREIARMAIRLRDSVSNEFIIRHMPNVTLKLRVGIHTGPVVAGVVGLKMPRYCLFGDTVNTAARMEQNGKELKIHISPHTKEVLDEFGTFDLKRRKQSVTLKGLGEWNTWWLVGEMKRTEEFDSVEKPAGPIDDVYASGGKRQLKQSVSSFASSSSEVARLSESSAEYSSESAFETDKENNILTQTENSRTRDGRKGNGLNVPARYRPSCLANPSKQRRNGSLTPLLVQSHLDSGIESGNFSFSEDRLGLIGKANDYTAIGAIF